MQHLDTYPCSSWVADIDSRQPWQLKFDLLWLSTPLQLFSELEFS